MQPGGAGGMSVVPRSSLPNRSSYSAGKGRTKVARAFGVDPSTLRRLLMKEASR